MYQLAQHELTEDGTSVDGFVAQIGRDDPHLYGKALELAGSDENPIIRLIRLHDLLHDNPSSINHPSPGPEPRRPVRELGLRATIALANAWDSLVQESPRTKRLFCAGAAIAGLGLARQGYYALGGIPEPDQYSVGAVVAGTLCIGIAKEGI